MRKHLWEVMGVAAVLTGGASACSTPAPPPSLDASATDTGVSADAREDSSPRRDGGHTVTGDARHDAPDDAAEKDAAPSDSARDVTANDAGHDGGADATADAGHDAGHDVAVDAFVCDATQSPHDEPCVINEAYGVFVAAVFGSDLSGDGSRLHPYATLGAGITKAAGKRVYACAATYAESVVVNVTVDGTQVYGGLACPGAGDAAADAGGPAWSYTGEPVVVAPTTTGYALSVQSLTTGAHFEDISFIAKAGAAAGPSSIAVMVNASTGLVSFTRGGATAGAGLDGTTAAAPGSNWCGTAAAPAGGPGAEDAPGGAGGVCQCALTPSKSTGGVGGADVSGASGGAGTPAVTGSGGGGVDLPGQPGAQGTSTAGGTAGAGSLTSSGWVLTAAVAGGAGGVAQGGGGGGGDTIDITGDDYIDFSGGGGGAGGCGGTGGGAGTSGGASIAVAVVSSSVTFASVTLVTAAGGAGGAGATGQTGQTGGVGGTGPHAGGVGGDGAGGSGGGGGAGGPSVGIAWTGSAPTVDGLPDDNSVTLSGPSKFTGALAGAAGAGGPGGTSSGNAGKAGASGPAGVAAAVAELP